MLRPSEMALLGPHLSSVPMETRPGILVAGLLFSPAPGVWLDCAELGDDGQRGANLASGEEEEAWFFSLG